MSKLVLKTDHEVEITRTLEVIYGTCGIGEILDTLPDGTSELEYDGAGTDVDWNSQAQVTREGQRVFLDDDGNEYLENELELIPDEVVGAQFRFAYPVELTTLEDYSAHRGQVVTVTRATTTDERDHVDCGMGYWVRADDGWEGIADMSELEQIDE